MSVIVEDSEGDILLLCKGADDVIMQRSDSTEKEQA
jgi:magnesium-transporting ATPase (P-type)